MVEEIYYFVASDYSATGEGRTVNLLITRAYPKSSDYLVQPDFKENENGVWEYKEGTLKVSRAEIALRNFEEKVKEPFFADGAIVLSRDDFFKNYDPFVPSMIKRIISKENPQDHPGGFEWYQEFHFNYS